MGRHSKDSKFSRAFHDTLLDGLVSIAAEDRRIRALWIEADDPKCLRRPYGPVRIHAVADEPDFPALVQAWEQLVSRVGQLVHPRWSDTRRNAQCLEVEVILELEGRQREKVSFVLECSAFLAKRPRKGVVALLDKTGHLTHVMDFAR